MPAGANWRYLDDGSDQSAVFADPAFDDSSWATGAAPLGYGNGDEATVVGFGPSAGNKFITTWFRHAFSVTAHAPSNFALLRLRRDDGAVVYLDGSEIFRSDMPAGAINYLTQAPGAASDATEYNFFSVAIDPALLPPGPHLLAVEVHQQSPSSADLVLDAELLTGDREFVTRGPYLQTLTDSSVIVSWQTHVPTLGRVWYGTQHEALGQFVDDGVLDTLHSVTLTRLGSSTSYHYAVATPNDLLVGNDGAHMFSTAPQPGSSTAFRIWAQGDSGTGKPVAEDVANAFLDFNNGAPPDVWLMLGDNAYAQGTTNQYQAGLFDRFPSILAKTALWPARGNHDAELSVYQSLFQLPTAGEAGGVPSGTESYYSFDWANVHFLCVDSEGSDPSVGSAMWNWADADLAATSAEWIIAYWHHPPYSKGTHNSDAEAKLIAMREQFVPMLEDHGVDLVLCAHSHDYERSFLVDGHYGLSGSFAPSMQLDAGDGSPLGDGGYAKATGPHQGSVYCVAGSAAKLGSGLPLNHPAMAHSVALRGSLVIDVDGNQLQLSFVTDTGSVEDSFSLRKAPVWRNLGQVTSGSTGSPLLFGQGPLVADKLIRLKLTGALPGGLATLAVGLTQDDLPFKGGVLVPSLDAVLSGLPVDGAGGLVVNGTWPAGVPAGTETFYQVWISDPGGPQGFAASNALAGKAP